jgi:hypothetical protein
VLDTEAFISIAADSSHLHKISQRWRKFLLFFRSPLGLRSWLQSVRARIAEQMILNSVAYCILKTANSFCICCKSVILEPLSSSKFSGLVIQASLKSSMSRSSFSFHDWIGMRLLAWNRRSWYNIDCA